LLIPYLIVPDSPLEPGINKSETDNLKEQLLQENTDLIDKIEQMKSEKQKYEIRDNSLEIYSEF